MTEPSTTFDQTPDPGAGSSTAPVSTGPAEAPALITEQQVLFGTAAAVALPPAKTRRFSDAVHAVAGTLRAVFVSSDAEPRERRHYPSRNDYLEPSRMAREMHRL
jgi:hypothetical protein